ncbi:hypothetical protein BRARA_A01696 [Brassica rapa]|uniref:Uncharacterized protein n=1 Tax=Brassica campestris TaxID=3711 RepID=A0A398AUK1_BRACM|nr:hypothetical protein BRARA_A01696 [Brassica rapa]
MPEAPKNESLEVFDLTLDEKNKRRLQLIEELTSNADQVQRRVLEEILTRNADVEYLRRHDLDGRTDRETFKNVMPVITYEDIQPEINRIANGDKSPILSSKPISEFLTSSGTSGGERKLMPTIEEELDRRSFLYSFLMPVMSQFVPGLDKGKGMYFLFIKSESKTPGGLPARPVLTSYYKSSHFKERPFDPYTNYTSPNETILCPDSYQSVTNSINLPKALTEKEQQELVDLVDVKLGQEYELVVTTYAGLCRYRVGDLLKVTGFKNKAPQFSFICRKNVVLSIDSDKTDEVELQNAVKNAVTHLVPFDASVSEYTSYADTSSIPGHYVLFWELCLDGNTPIPPSVFEDCCLALEESLNTVYRQGRVSDKSIGPLEIKIVEPGTFDKLMDYAISLGASINQYKTPRCVKFAPIIELLNSRVVDSYFSPKCPKWVPGHKQWGSN